MILAVITIPALEVMKYKPQSLVFEIYLFMYSSAILG